MRIPKKYGQSKVDKCPFCNMPAVVNNSQGVPVCSKHRDKKLEDAKCVCGETLELRTGKFGAYFHCLNCGNISFSKAMSVNDFTDKKSQDSKKDSDSEKPKNEPRLGRKEITVTSDELDFLY